jgi:hypothetical protein
LRTDAHRVEQAQRSNALAHSWVMEWALKPDGKKALTDIESKYGMPTGGEFFTVFNRDAMKDLMMACHCRRIKKNIARVNQRRRILAKKNPKSMTVLADGSSEIALPTR